MVRVYHAHPLRTRPDRRQSVCDTPGVHDVPAAIAIGTLQLPLAHRWKDVPPMQFHAPSSVQAPDSVLPPPLDPLPVPLPVAVPVPAGAAADVVPADAAGTVDVARVVAAAVSEVAAVPPPPWDVRKTPPEREEAEDETLEQRDCELGTLPSGVKEAAPVKVLVMKVLADVLSVAYGGRCILRRGRGEDEMEVRTLASLSLSLRLSLSRSRHRSR